MDNVGTNLTLSKVHNMNDQPAAKPEKFAEKLRLCRLCISSRTLS